jgi:hypothetical protein
LTSLIGNRPFDSIQLLDVWKGISVAILGSAYTEMFVRVYVLSGANIKCRGLSTNIFGHATAGSVRLRKSVGVSTLQDFVHSYNKERNAECSSDERIPGLEPEHVETMSSLQPLF